MVAGSGGRWHPPVGEIVTPLQDLARHKVTQHVTLTYWSQISVWGVPILKIAAIIAPGNAGEHC